MAHPRRVVITGMGLVTSLGDRLEPFWSALCAGRSGVGPLTLFDTTEFKVKFGGPDGWAALLGIGFLFFVWAILRFYPEQYYRYHGAPAGGAGDTRGQ